MCIGPDGAPTRVAGASGDRQGSGTAGAMFLIILFFFYLCFVVLWHSAAYRQPVDRRGEVGVAPVLHGMASGIDSALVRQSGAQGDAQHSVQRHVWGG